MKVYSVNIQAQGKTENVEVRGCNLAVAVKRALDRFSNAPAATVIVQRVGVVEYGWVVAADVPNAAGGYSRFDLTAPKASKHDVTKEASGFAAAHPTYRFVRATRRELGVKRFR